MNLKTKANIHSSSICNYVRVFSAEGP